MRVDEIERFLCVLVEVELKTGKKMTGLLMKGGEEGLKYNPVYGPELYGAKGYYFLDQWPDGTSDMFRASHVKKIRKS